MSTLTNPHIIAGDFNAALFSFIKSQEGFVPRIYLDGKNVPTLGIGYALVVRNEATRVYALRQPPELTQQMGALGITLGDDPQRIDDDMDILRAAVAALNGTPVPAGVPTIAHWNAGSPDPNNTPFSYGTITEPQFQPLFNLLVDAATTTLIAKIGQPVFSALAGSSEMVALLSLTFNSPSLIGSKLIAALQDGNRAEAWYEIRYDSNGGASRSAGIANRRYAESDLFGLYNGDPAAPAPDVAEAKDVLRMYTTNRSHIVAYESTPGFGPPTLSLATYLAPGRDRLITEFAQSRPIDGEVLVGRDNLFSSAQFPERLSGTATGDLILGEAGRDRIEGLGGNDVLYGGLGDDQLTGGTGDDYLDGGFDNDTYYWNTGDGNDRIEDALGRNVIVADQRILVGGILADRGSREHLPQPGRHVHLCSVPGT